ncbi:MAG: DNA polymerase III subunit delta [Bacteroidales bacterium]|nr:DNA polymerase III subunit delta [Bacteroidales bacterium]
MAKQGADNELMYERVCSDISSGNIKPFYLLFGKEHYYIDKVCDLLIDKVLTEEERAFGQIVYYGADVTAEQVVSTARQFPMMVSRQLVVVKEAQMMKKVEDIYDYFSHLMPTTVLVICYKTPTDPMVTKNIDKRTKFYKEAGGIGEVLEFVPTPEYNMPLRIEKFVSRKGYRIEPDAAALFAEFCGTELNKVESELEKISKNLPAGSLITASVIEENVGLMRDYSVFELTKALTAKDAATVYKITSFFSQAQKRYPMQFLASSIASQFIRLLKYHAAVQQKMDRTEISAYLGLSPYFLREYENGARNYNLQKTMKVISILKEYDYRSKSNLRGSADDGELHYELVSKILNT